MCRRVRLAVVLALLSLLPCVGAEAEKPGEQATGQEDSEVRKRLAICDDFFRKLERRVSFEFNETPLSEAIDFVMLLAKVGAVSEGGTATAEKITLKHSDVSLGFALSEVLAKVGLDWTIGVFPRLDAGGSETLKVYIADPVKIKVMNEKYPEVARAGADFRAKVRVQDDAGDSPQPPRKLTEEERRREAGFRRHPDDLTPEERVGLSQAFCRHLERKASAEFVETPLQELLTFVQTLAKASIELAPQAATSGAATTKVTYLCKDMPCGLILDDVLAKVGLDWTICVVVCVDTPEHIKELNRKYPEMARVVAEFRERMRAEVKAQQAALETGKAKQGE